MTLPKLLAGIAPTSREAAALASSNWDEIAKPLGSLGILEKLVIQLSAIRETDRPQLLKRAVAVFCADNGVVEEGVTQCGSDVTAVIAKSIAAGKSSVCRMAAVANAEVFPVDVGVESDLSDFPTIINKKVVLGTKNMTKAPAMTRAQTEQAILAGATFVGELKALGYDIICSGEMGIGNTTTATAVLSVLLSVPPTLITGRGAGLSDEGLARKIAAVEKGIALHSPMKADVIDTLSKVGGLDIAAIVGLFLGGGFYKLPIVIDGFITSVAALCAVKLCPLCEEYMMASHVSAEPAGKMIMEELGKPAVINAKMRLGEGSGAVALLPLLDMALAAYSDAPNFSQLEMEHYQPFGG